MHKKSLGLSSVIMAGMLAVSSVSPAGVTAYATETGDGAVIAAQEDVAEEQKSEEVSEEEEPFKGDCYLTFFMGKRRCL